MYLSVDGILKAVFICYSRFLCNVCAMANEVPGEYMARRHHEGQHDPRERPELANGSVEYIAPQEYMVGQPIADILCDCLHARRLGLKIIII